MGSTTLFTSQPLLHGGKPTVPFPLPTPLFKLPQTRTSLTRNLRASAQHHPTRSTSSSSSSSAAGTLALAAASAALLAARLVSPPLALAAAPPPPPQTVERLETTDAEDPSPSVLSQHLDSNPDAIDAVRSLVYRKLELGEDHEALGLIEQLVAARPDDLEWRFLHGRLLNEMGHLEDARKVFDEILEREPLSFEALFESAVLMDRCGEGEAAMERLRGALEAARGEGKEKEARDVRLIMAQMQFLQKKVEEALESYEELAREDPKDYRPYFCQGVIYTLLDRSTEAREKLNKYKELSPRKLDVDGYVQTPLSRMKLFGTSDD